MRLTLMLINNEKTNQTPVNALLALMCFHASRFDARHTERGENILYDDQDESLWQQELIQQGEYFLNKASVGREISKYHLEAAIAYWHTQKADSSEKWENILQLYNQLLQIEYSPIAALNRTFARSKATGNAAAVKEAEKLNLKDNHFYFALLGHLYTDLDTNKAVRHYEMALKLAKTTSDKVTISKKMAQLVA